MKGRAGDRTQVYLWIEQMRETRKIEAGGPGKPFGKVSLKSSVNGWGHEIMGSFIKMRGNEPA